MNSTQPTSTAPLMPQVPSLDLNTERAQFEDAFIKILVSFAARVNHQVSPAIVLEQASQLGATMAKMLAAVCERMVHQTGLHAAARAVLEDEARPWVEREVSAAFERLMADAEHPESHPPH